MCIRDRVKDVSTSSPPGVVETSAWSAARACSSETPARQLWLSPMSSPMCADSAATPELAAQFDQAIGRCHPGELHAVVAELRAEHRLVGQGRIGEIPGVGM